MPATYVIPDVQLIPQDQEMACWYASAQMVIQWRRSRLQMTEMGLWDPSEVNEAVSRYRVNNGLPANEFVRLAKLLGLRTVPLMSPTLEAVAGWLQLYGPIWTAGKQISRTGEEVAHIVVITGISDSGYYVLDPAPMNLGSQGWRPLSWLVTTLEWGVIDWNFRNFLHCPR